MTFTAVDSDDRQGQRSSTVTVVAPAEENDTDNDGMDDLFEVNNGLDPMRTTQPAMPMATDEATWMSIRKVKTRTWMMLPQF